jgi:hypothetical protein
VPLLSGCRYNGKELTEYRGDTMTFLEYTNIILQATNEVPLTSTQFSSARGLQEFTKEAVNRTYHDIIGEYRWPWMINADKLTEGAAQLSGERTLTPTDIWTVIPVSNPYKDAIDWSTMYYRNLEDEKQWLDVVSWDQFEASQDYYTALTGEPQYIVQSADGRSFGLIPQPATGEEGTLYYKIWARPSRFQYSTDIIPMPDENYSVLVDGALHHLWSFRGNVDQSQLAYARYEKGLKKMKQKYTNQTTRLYWT